VKPPPFAYARAESVEEALELLAEGGEDAKPLAGGQSLVPALSFRLVRPTHLVDIDRVAGLDGIRESDAALAVGALTRHVQLAQLATDDRFGALGAAARSIGHEAIRVRGTLGGSLAHSDPAAELPVVALALDAELVLAARDGRRTVAAADFFLGPFTTALAPGELLVEAAFAAPEGARTAFAEFAWRAGDFALACVCVGLAPGWTRIAVGGVGAIPTRATRAEALLSEGGREAFDEAAETAAQELEVYGDRTADEAYRRRLVRTLVNRALAQAWAAA
jgi:carbon-monoxide dehydrogenase medium subunit/6-hydroxypseudooxynicotine dehydrogenase subunit alpha